MLSDPPSNVKGHALVNNIIGTPLSNVSYVTATHKIATFNVFIHNTRLQGWIVSCPFYFTSPFSSILTPQYGHLFLSFLPSSVPSSSLPPSPMSLPLSFPPFLSLSPYFFPYFLSISPTLSLAFSPYITLPMVLINYMYAFPFSSFQISLFPSRSSSLSLSHLSLPPLSLSYFFSLSLSLFFHLFLPYLTILSPLLPHTLITLYPHS